jgi:hypothetical protein
MTSAADRQAKSGALLMKNGAAKLCKRRIVNLVEAVAINVLNLEVVGC